MIVGVSWGMPALVARAFKYSRIIGGSGIKHVFFTERNISPLLVFVR